MSATPARLLWGLVLVARPDLPLRAVGGESRGTCAAARVLGARHLAEVALIPDRPALLASADGLHAVSMVLLAARRRSLARVALPSAAIATALATWTLR